MAGPNSAILNMDDHDDEEELKFQDFGVGDGPLLSKDASYDHFADSGSLNEEETAGLLSKEEKSTPSFWEFSYYQSFFDVDTDQVLRRILWSMIPRTGGATYLQRHIKPVPDLYGPFWISATLVFTTAISANIAEYLRSAGKTNRIWHYDFHKVSFAATAIYSYAFLLPLGLWGLLWYRGGHNRYSLLEMLCVYGYSLFIYIPISILWVVQVEWLQWLLVIIGAMLSGSVLVHTFWPVVKEEKKKIAVIVLVLILLFHTLLAVGFLAYFFRPSQEVKKASSLQPSVTSTTVKITSSSNKLEYSQKITPSLPQVKVAKSEVQSESANDETKSSITTVKAPKEKENKDKVMTKNKTVSKRNNAFPLEAGIQLLT